MQNIDLEKLKDSIIDVAKELASDNLYRIYLYGSYARGDFDEESDVDIMIILDCGKESVEKYRKRMCHYASLMGLEFDKEISILMRDKETFYNNNISAFYNNIIQEGIVLYG